MSLPPRDTPAETGNEIWLLTLSDLLVLLLIFFILYFGMTMHKQSLAVQEPPMTAPVVQEISVIPSPAAPEEITILPPPESSSLEADLMGLLGDQAGEQGVTVERRAGHIVMTFPEQLLFDSGLSRLKTSVEPLLERVAVIILHHPAVSTEIQGHTDDRPISSQRYPSNWELSADRAAQVARALVQRGVDPAGLSIRGFGEYRPLQANDSDLNRLKNRRVEIQFSLSPSQS